LRGGDGVSNIKIATIRVDTQNLVRKEVDKLVELIAEKTGFECDIEYFDEYGRLVKRG
jgi:hypothetical protein